MKFEQDFKLKEKSFFQVLIQCIDWTNLLLVRQLEENTAVWLFWDI